MNQRIWVGFMLSLTLGGCALLPTGLSTQSLTGSNEATSSVPVSQSDSWEYRFERDDGTTPMTKTRADALGADGWELVSIVHDTSSSGWYDTWAFKRRKKS